MSICVAVGNKVMDTRLPQPAGCGDKYDVLDLGSGLLRRCTPRNDAEGNNIAFKGLDAVRQCALKFFKTAESGVDKVVSSCEKNPSVHWRYMNFLRQRKTTLDAPLHAVSAGRSMIEMLGVLAIIAVLTVGGIAGYSKAMKRYQANKVVGEIIQVLANLKELSENDKLFDINNLDDETKKTLGLCLPSAENCDYFQPTPVGRIMINSQSQFIDMIDADAELCISAFNNIVAPLKGNIAGFDVRTEIKNRDGTSSSSAICISENKEMCGSAKYLNLYDSRVVTEINATCNSGTDKKAYRIRLVFKQGFIGGY